MSTLRPGSDTLPRFMEVRPGAIMPWYASGTAPKQGTPQSGPVGGGAPAPEQPKAPSWKTLVDITYGVGDPRAGQQRLIAADPAFQKPQPIPTGEGAPSDNGTFGIGLPQGPRIPQGPQIPQGPRIPENNFPGLDIGRLQAMAYPEGALGRGLAPMIRQQHPMDALSGFSNAHLQYMGLL